MPPRCSTPSVFFLPFLYPTLFRPLSRIPRRNLSTAAPTPSSISPAAPSTETATPVAEAIEEQEFTVHEDVVIPISRLNPLPDDYSASSFADKAKVTIQAGSGGHGCISFLREAFMANGPANGGDGGHGGNVYIQAVSGENSLYKLARRRVIRAGHGKTGQGSNRGGARGDDLIIQVPIGTVVREISRYDPKIEENQRYRELRAKEREYNRLVREAEEAAAKAEEDEEEEGQRPARFHADLPDPPEHPNAHKFVLYPGISTSERQSLSLPRLPSRDRLYAQPEAPIYLDLSVASPRPILLAAGGLGGLGNPNFVSKDRPRPLFATKGERAVRMDIELELKLLADLGFVGLPNAGKSTLLRALTRSRARVGNWAFTTLHPNIGTVVLDNNKGRPIVKPQPPRPSPTHSIIHDATHGSVVVAQSPMDWQMRQGPEPRTRFTIADIPGLIEGAHLDRGLGIEFLRHVERAGVLAFVIDLNAGDAVAALKSLWNEVGMYARMREDEERERETNEAIDWEGDGSKWPSGQMMIVDMPDTVEEPTGLRIASKPWFVIATKADLRGTQDNFSKLKEYLDNVTSGKEIHPSGLEEAWVDDVAAIPVSAIHGQGVDRIVHWTLGLLDG